MEVIRVLGLKRNGEYILNLEIDPLNLREAVFYLDKVTNEMTDEEFLSWLQDKMLNGSFTKFDRLKLQEAVYGTKYPFLQKVYNKLPGAISVVIDLLVDANNLLVDIEKSNKEKLEGGKADGRSSEEIADHHNVSNGDIQDEYA